MKKHFITSSTELVSLTLALSILNSMEIAAHHNGSLIEQIHNAKTPEEKSNLQRLQSRQQQEVNNLVNQLKTGSWI